jgi:hypothetical protein
VTVHDLGVVDTSIIAALKLYDPADLPDRMLITAITLSELSYGPSIGSDDRCHSRQQRPAFVHG